MISMGEIVDDTLRALRRSNDEEARNSVRRFVNKFYFGICRAISIKDFRRSVEVDLSSGDYSSGMWLKSNMVDILRVLDIDDEFDYIHRDKASIDADEPAYRYYDYVPSGDALYTGDDAKVLKGESSFSSSALTANHTGEYVKFGQEYGFYLLTAAKTFSPVYWGNGLESEDFVVRPKGTHKIVCIDQGNDEITDRSILVDYWEYPSPLYKKSDVPLLSSTRALELMVMKEAMVIIGKRQLSANTYDRDIKAAMDELRKLNPPPSPRLRARDKMNMAFTMATNIFTNR